MQRDWLFAAVIAGLFAATGISSIAALAQDDMRSPGERRSTEDANISLAEAIRAAEREVGGRAVETDVEYHGRMTVYEVEILRDGRTYKVHVDAQNGDVIRTVSADDDDEDRRSRNSDDDDN
jgi:uncharacterized membrane protein YkoI